MNRTRSFIGLILSAVMIFCLAARDVQALPTTWYVSNAGLETALGSNGWSNAVFSISNAIAKAAAVGDTIIVSNGTYNPVVTITINKSVTITGVSGDLAGAAQTIVNGNTGPFTGFTISSSSITTTVCGLTITNFFAGGISVYPGNLILDHCIVSGNSNSAWGGGVYANGAGSLWVKDCAIIGNTNPLTRTGAGIYTAITTCRVENSIISYNFGGQAAGIHGQGMTIINNCMISSNGAPSNYQGGGGVSLGTAGSRIYNSSIIGNKGANNGGGILMSYGMIVEDCLIANNIGWTGGGVMNDGGTVRNCTIVGNYGQNWSGGVGAHAASYGASVNCIVYSNGYDNWTAGLSGTFTNCCTSPNPGAAGINCITANPLLKNYTASDFHIASTSQCVNAGLYDASWMVGARDRDGLPRARDGKVDIGCYQQPPPQGSVIFTR